MVPGRDDQPQALGVGPANPGEQGQVEAPLARPRVSSATTAAWRVPVLGVPRGLGPLLVLLLAAPDAQRIAGQVQHRILQHRRVAGREHERSRSNHSGSKRRNRVHNI